MSTDNSGAGMFAPGGSVKYKHQIKSIQPLHDVVLVRDMSFEGRVLSSGIMLLGDDAKSEGIRPRWARVYAVGPEQQDVTAGQWVLIEHGRWSRGMEVEVNDETFTLRRVDPECIIFVSDTEPDTDDTISTALVMPKKSLG
jgi:co-chaperonin GroES (HSP10)